MKRIVRLTENDLTRIVKRVLNEQIVIRKHSLMDNLIASFFAKTYNLNSKYRQILNRSKKINNNVGSKLEQIANALGINDSVDQLQKKYITFLKNSLGISDINNADESEIIEKWNKYVGK